RFSCPGLGGWGGGSLGRGRPGINGLVGWSRGRRLTVRARWRGWLVTARGCGRRSAAPAATDAAGRATAATAAATATATTTVPAAPTARCACHRGCTLALAFADNRLGGRCGLPFKDRIAEPLHHQLDRPHAVVVARNRQVNQIRVAVGIEQRHHLD